MQKLTHEQIGHFTTNPTCTLMSHFLGYRAFINNVTGGKAAILHPLVAVPHPSLLPHIVAKRTRPNQTKPNIICFVSDIDILAADKMKGVLLTTAMMI